MENKKSRNLIAAAIAITAAAVIVLLVAGFAAAGTDYEPTGWVLKAYGNSVALYNGDEIKAIYGEVELDTLPPEDVRMLESGIAFPTRAEAETAIEDYDG